VNSLFGQLVAVSTVRPCRVPEIVDGHLRFDQKSNRKPSRSTSSIIHSAHSRRAV
jgi:hypothetical protein